MKNALDLRVVENSAENSMNLCYSTALVLRHEETPLCLRVSAIASVHQNAVKFIGAGSADFEQRTIITTVARD